MCVSATATWANTTTHRMNQLALVSHNGNMDNDMSRPMAPASSGFDPKAMPMSIATISSGFEKGDFLVREEKGQRVVSAPTLQFYGVARIK